MRFLDALIFLFHESQELRIVLVGMVLRFDLVARGVGLLAEFSDGFDFENPIQVFILFGRVAHREHGPLKLAIRDVKAIIGLKIMLYSVTAPIGVLWRVRHAFLNPVDEGCLFAFRQVFIGFWCIESVHRFFVFHRYVLSFLMCWRGGFGMDTSL